MLLIIHDVASSSQTSAAHAVNIVKPTLVAGGAQVRAAQALGEHNGETELLRKSLSRGLRQVVESLHVMATGMRKKGLLG